MRKKIIQFVSLRDIVMTVKIVYNIYRKFYHLEDIMTVLKKIATMLLICSIIAGICCLLPSGKANAASKPGTPEISLEASVGGKGIKVYISDTGNASGYRVYMKKPGASKYIIVKTFKKTGGTGCVYTISELDKGTYTVCVKAYSKASGKKVWGTLSKKLKITIGEKDPQIDSYLAKNYPAIKDLADKGLVGVHAEYKPDTIVLGKWDMDSFDPKQEWFFPDGKKEDLEWQVLEYSDDGKSALVISRYVICLKDYYDDYCNPSVKWEDSAVYKWLKGEFYDKAFTKSEKSLIEDEITVLSASEAEWYFKTDYHRIGQTIDGSLSSWGLKSFSDDKTEYAMVSEIGSLYYSDSYYEIGVRPVFRIKLNSDIIKANKLSVGNKYEKEIDKVYVTLGSFDMDDFEGKTDNNKELLEWEILDQDKKNGTALLLSRYVISNKEYTDGSDKTMWEKSPIRKWLNEDFYETAFSDKEKNLIQKTVINNNDSSEYNGKMGNDTIDRLFILSPYEYYKYFNPKNINCNFYPGMATYFDEINAAWHLRFSYIKGGFSAYVNQFGCPITTDDYCYEYGIRPAMVISTDPDKKQDSSKPDIPEFELENSDDGSILVTIRNDDADGYRILVKAPNETKYTAVKTLKKSTGESTVYKLKNKVFGEYYFQVKAYKLKGGKKIWGNSLENVSIDHERPEGILIRNKEFEDKIITQYAKDNYPELYELAEKGGFSLSGQLKSYDTIKLGSWKTEDRDGKSTSKKKQDIEWEILEYSKDKKSALVISKNILCFRPYDTENQYLATWDDSTIRKWLNEDFFNTAFTKEEQKLILNENVKELNLALKGMDTVDRIFLLSDDELKKYLSDLRAASADGKYSEWWIRTVAKGVNAYSYIDSIYDVDEWYSYYGQYAVLEDGKIDNDELNANKALGIRPAFRIKLTDEIICENNLVFDDDLKPEVEDIYIETKSGNHTDTWIILDYDEKEQKALLMCTEYLDEIAYEEDEDEITWEGSTLRDYLNGSQYYGRLPKGFRKLILKTKLVNEDNEQYGTDGGNDTKDYVFIFSLSEYNKYLAPGSGNEKYLDILLLNEDYYYSNVKWWLRTPGSSPAKALYTSNSNTSGNINMEGKDIDAEIFAYPVVWISLKSGK